jgi:hypothetical protein
MGLDYSYLLYFKREDLWDVLQGVAGDARPCKLPVLVVFPEYILPLQIESWGNAAKIVKHDDPEFGFAISMFFPEDELIKEYISRIFPNGYEFSDERPGWIPIGYITMTVYNDLSKLDRENADPNLVMIEFGTTGTKMSILFLNSTSIRGRFVELLEKYRGVCGVFNMEMKGHVFWLNGREVDGDIPDPWIPPKEVEGIMTKHPKRKG